MTENIRVMIADANVGTSSALIDALKAKGFDTIHTPDGPSALQKAISDIPGMIILAVELPTIDGIKLSQILRSNPRTENIPFIFLSESEMQIAHFQKHRDLLFIKPFNVNEVISRIRSYFERVNKTRELSRENKIIEGNLSEVSLPDLLQLFHLNRKEGRLSIHSNVDDGDILIKDGNVFDATIRKIVGEKALYRLLTLKKGSFKFYPSIISSSQRITRPSDNLIMEGLRQFDEMEVLKESFPSLDARLKLMVDPSTLPKGLRPITQEIFLQLEFNPKLSDVIDSNSFPDYEVMRTIVTMISKGIVSITQETTADDRPILEKEDALKLKERLSAGKNYRLETELGKIMVFYSNSNEVRGLVDVLNLLPEFNVNNNLVKEMETDTCIGSCGMLRITEGININFVIMPSSDKFSPIWRPLSTSMLCGLGFLDTEARIDDAGDIFKSFSARLSKPVGFFVTDGNANDARSAETRKFLGNNNFLNLYPLVKKDIGRTRAMLGTLFQNISRAL